MPVPILVGAGLIMGGIGLYQQNKASKQMAEAQRNEIAQQQALEAQRKKQMDLEFKRQQLQVVRNQQRARAMSLATATAQGAAQGSVLPGAYGGISGQANTQLLAGAQNYQIGGAMFGINQQIGNARMSYADATSDYRAGQGLSSLGGMMVSNAGTLSSVGRSTYSSMQHAMSFGTGPGAWSGGRV